jgi:hypothetical protein
MTNIENIRDLFSILHDGTILNWKGNKKSLTLEVGCEYLAERIDPSFEVFFIELTDILRLALVPWMKNELEQEYFIELGDIFRARLNISFAEIENEFVKVSCSLSDNSFDYCGGPLYIYCKGIKVYNQDKIELTIDKLSQISKEYWDEFARQ